MGPQCLAVRPLCVIHSVTTARVGVGYSTHTEWFRRAAIGALVYWSDDLNSTGKTSAGREYVTAQICWCGYMFAENKLQLVDQRLLGRRSKSEAYLC